MVESLIFGFMRVFQFSWFVALLCLGFVVGEGIQQAVAAASWPQFRGPNGAGTADQQKPPVEFGPGTNEVFKVSVPPGASSPCIWGDRIFLTAFENGKLQTLCLSRGNGKLLWQKAAPSEKLEAFHPTESSPAASTPATDGTRVYVYFGSCGLLAYSMDGKELWSIPMPPATHMGDLGSGTSPIVHGGLVVLNRDMLRGSHILAVNAKSGKELWRQERPDFISSYSTPIIWEHNGETEVVVAGSQRMKGYALKNGKEMWQVPGLPNGTCTTPVLGDGMLFFAGWSPGAKDFKVPVYSDLLEKHDDNKDGMLQRKEVKSEEMIAMIFTFWDVNGDGNMTAAEYKERLAYLSVGANALLALRPGKSNLEIVWKETRGLPYVPSPLFYGGLVYVVKDGGMVSCFDARTGKAHYQQERLGPTGSYYSSPVAADGKIYLISVTGKVTVLAAGDRPVVLRKSDLGERCVTTPAIVDDAIYVRTAKYLWKFGKS
jgi:outer membrane protein assembly factor BamB